MNVAKVRIAAYNLLAYLLPGYIIVVACSLVESTFIGTWFLCLSVIRRDALTVTVVAYCVGHIANGIASWLTSLKPRHFERELLGGLVYGEVTVEKEKTCSTVGLQNSKPFDIHLLADEYVRASGGGAGHEMLLAREGFFKQSVAAVGVLAAVLLLADLRGGVIVQTRAGRFEQLMFWPSAILTGATLLVASLFLLRFSFYHRLKMNYAMLFKAQRAREME